MNIPIAIEARASRVRGHRITLLATMESSLRWRQTVQASSPEAQFLGEQCIGLCLPVVLG
jgi:hypothetical protein